MARKRREMSVEVALVEATKGGEEIARECRLRGFYPGREIWALEDKQSGRIIEVPTSHIMELAIMGRGEGKLKLWMKASYGEPW